MVKHIFIKLEDDLHRRLKGKCYENGKTLQEAVRILIKKYVDGEIQL
jgi:predicted DNA-binding protein